jgi:hypothetical protein
MEGPTMQQRNKGPRRKMTVMSEEWEGIWQDIQDDCRAGDRKVSSRVFSLAEESEWLDIAEVSAPTRTEKKVDGDTPGLTSTLWGNCWDKRP